MSMFMLGLSKRMKEICTSMNEISQMSKTRILIHQMMTFAMAEFSSVELGSMTVSSCLHTCSTGKYMDDIIQSAVTGNRRASD